MNKDSRPKIKYKPVKMTHSRHLGMFNTDQYFRQKTSATPDTPWRVTRLGKHSYFEAYLKEAEKEGGLPRIDAFRNPHTEDLDDPLTDVHAINREKVVSVTPLSLDLTSRVDLLELQRSFGTLE